MQTKKVLQILFGAIIVAVCLGVFYYLGKEYGWFEKYTSSVPAEKEKTLREILFEKGSAPPDATSTLTPEEREILFEKGSAPLDATSTLTTEEREILLEKGSAP